MLTAATPVSWFQGEEPFGVDTTLHLFPFQCSAKVLAPAFPTAHRSFAAAPPIALSVLISAYPPGAIRFGDMLRLHCVPFQCRMNDWRPDWPTAHALLAVSAATPLRKFSVPFGLGVAIRDQLLPFQWSARACALPFRLPTAQTSLLALAETPFSAT